MGELKTSDLLTISKRAFERFRENDPIRLGASTAFFTFFALPPILTLLINAMGTVSSNRVVSGELYQELAWLFGARSAAQVRTISNNFQYMVLNVLVTLVGFVLLTFIATTLFAVVKNSLHQLWRIKQKPKNTFATFIKDRLVGLVIILFSGLLFLCSLLVDTGIKLAAQRLQSLVPHYSLLLVQTTQQVLSLLIITIWFAALFKYLPDVRISWKAVGMGGLVTAVLFKTGKLLLQELLINSNLGTLYGASDSVILILLFMFYSSMLFYFGAAFTKAFAEFTEVRMEPKAQAVEYEITEVEKP